MAVNLARIAATRIWESPTGDLDLVGILSSGQKPLSTSVVDKIEGSIRIFTIFRESTAQNYNYFPAIFLAPFILVFGPSREIYIVNLVISYLLPFTILMRALSTTIANQSIRLFWPTVFTTIALPAVWMPTLRGYPDIGAAALIATTMLVYLHDQTLSSRWQVIVLGISVGLAILFRRHVVYDAIALFLTIVIQTVLFLIYQVRQNKLMNLH
jgi:hypothetical protein